MLKRFFELLGLITMGVGLSIISTEHAKNSVCSAGGPSIHRIGVSDSCMHIVWSYFGGFVLLALGLLVVVFGLLASRRPRKRRRSPKNRSIASTWVWTDTKMGHDSAQNAGQGTPLDLTK